MVLISAPISALGMVVAVSWVDEPHFAFIASLVFGIRIPIRRSTL